MTKRIRVYTEEQKERQKAYMKEYDKTRNLVYKERRKEIDRERRLQNGDKLRADYRAWALNNPDKVKAKDKKYAEENPEKKALCYKNWAEKNKQYRKDYTDLWNLNNPYKIKQYRVLNAPKTAILIKKRRQEDPVFRLICNLRSRIGSYCKSIKSEKNFKTKESLGCGPQEFKGYFEALFQPNMTWENYGVGGWVVDHIKPISLAKTINEVYLLNHYTNLQPMWELDNLRKYNKYV